jgi:hypothetical protein
MTLLRIVGIGMILASGASLVSATPPGPVADWISWALGNAMVILAVWMIANDGSVRRK